MTDLRLDHHSGLTQFLINTLLAHNIQGLIQHAPHIQGFIAIRTGRNIHGNDNICAHIFGRFDRNRTDQATIDIFGAANHGRDKHIRNTAGSTNRLSGIAFNKISFTPIVQTCGNSCKTNRELFNRFIRHIFIDEILQFLSGNNPLPI